MEAKIPSLNFISPPSLTLSPPLSVPSRPSALQTPFAAFPSWAVTTHVFPAASPRCRQPLQTAIPSGAPRVGKEAAEAAKEEVFERQRGQSLSPSKEAEQPLWITVNRYRPTTKSEVKGKGRGLTLVLAHANGLHKEVSLHSLAIL